MLVDLYKNTNTSSKTYGQIYGRVFSRDGLNLKGFAKHLTEHGKLASYEMLVLVLQNIVSCLKELLCEGIPVKLDGLGTFTAGLESSGASTVMDYDCGQNIKGVRINFRPEGAGDPDDRLTKKALLDICTFQLNDYVESFTKTVDGKEKRYQKRTPVSQYGVATAE